MNATVTCIACRRPLEERADYDGHNPARCLRYKREAAEEPVRPARVIRRGD